MEVMTSKGLFWVFQELWFLFNVSRGVSGSDSINWALWTLLMCETLGQYLLSTRYCNKRLLTFKKITMQQERIILKVWYFALYVI